jgi:hypothetical protein
VGDGFLPGDFEPARLEQALAAVSDTAWSNPSTFNETRVHHGYRRVVLVNGGSATPTAPPFTFILDDFAPVWEAWLSWIDPGGFIVPHKDGGPYKERWQVPLRPSGVWGADHVHTVGRCFQVTHWEPHSVTNDGDTPRIHLVIDRDVVANPDPSPFEVTHG